MKRPNKSTEPTGASGAGQLQSLRQRPLAPAAHAQRWATRKVMHTIRPITFFLMPLMLVAATGCQAPKATPPPFKSAQMSVGSDIQGKQYLSKITGDSLLGTPPWSRKRAQPPLSPGAAKRAATTMLAKTVADPQQWKLQEIRLRRPFDVPFCEEYWVYEILFTGPRYKSQFGSDTVSSLNACVLMNGEVVPLEPIGKK